MKKTGIIQIKTHDYEEAKDSLSPYCVRPADWFNGYGISSGHWKEQN